MPVQKRRCQTGAAIHFNGNLSVVVGYRLLYKDCPMTENHLTQLTLLPVNVDWSINPRFPILDIHLKPQLTYEEIESSPYPRTKNTSYKPIEYDESFAIFEAWFKSCRIDPGKKIACLGYDWPLIQHNLISWLGQLTFDLFFERRYCRDLISICSFMNDLAVHRDEMPTFYKVGKLSRILIDCGIADRKISQSLDMARLVAEAYRKIIYYPNTLLFYPITPAGEPNVIPTYSKADLSPFVNEIDEDDKDEEEKAEDILPSYSKNLAEEMAKVIDKDVMGQIESD